jgi:hypothetical protein
MNYDIDFRRRKSNIIYCSHMQANIINYKKY